MATVQAQITAEVAARKAADTALGTRIDKEVAARVAGDGALATKVAALEADVAVLKAFMGQPGPVTPPPLPVPPPAGETINVGAGGKGIVVSANNTTIDGKTILGPQHAAYVAGEVGIYAVGASAGSPITNLTIRNCTISGFGNYGILLQYVDGFTIENCLIEDVIYSGIMHIACKNGTTRNNTIHRVGYGVAMDVLPGPGNSYGIGVTGQGSDQSEDIVVSGNTVTDVPWWHGIDTHGGQRITFSGNTVRGSSRAMFLTANSGVSATDLVVSGNQLLSPTPATYNLVPLTLVDVDGITISGNRIQGWAGQSPPQNAPYYDYGGGSTGIVVGAGNVVIP